MTCCTDAVTSNAFLLVMVIKQIYHIYSIHLDSPSIMVMQLHVPVCSITENPFLQGLFYNYGQKQ